MTKNVLTRMLNVAESLPFQQGAGIGRAKANLFDQYQRGEIEDPRGQLEKIHELVDELIAGWMAHPATQQHAEHVKLGMDHGFKDSQGAFSALSKIEMDKQRKALQAEIADMKDGAKKQKAMMELEQLDQEMQAMNQPEEEPDMGTPEPSYLTRKAKRDEGKKKRDKMQSQDMGGG
mgnify:CR=1 FL=1